KGYTAFTLDITSLLELGKTNWIVVRADNAYSPTMLPRNDSYDWTPDGGIIRPVSVLVTPLVFVEDVWVDAWPQLDRKHATLAITVNVHNASTREVAPAIGYRIVEESTGRVVIDHPPATQAKVHAGAASAISLPSATFDNPRLWHFDHPHLYVLEVEVSDG